MSKVAAKKTTTSATIPPSTARSRRTSDVPPSAPAPVSGVRTVGERRSAAAVAVAASDAPPVAPAPTKDARSGEARKPASLSARQLARHAERFCREGAYGRQIRDALEDLYFGAFDLVNEHMVGGDPAADKLLRNLEMSYVDAINNLRVYEQELEHLRSQLAEAR